MKREFVDDLCCPRCHSDFSLQIDEQRNEEIIRGHLVCEACHAKYPIINSIPRIVPNQLLYVEKKTSDSFGCAWKHYGRQLSNNLNAEFLSLVRPWKESDFKDKVVLDVGCGAGRLSRLAASYGAKYVVSVDLSGAVDEALELSKDYSNIRFLQASLFNLPLKIKFDLIFSLGVLHHTPSPFSGFKSVLKSLKVGGEIGVWIYGKEGNKVMGPLMNLFRIITTRLNSRIRKRLSTIIVMMEEVSYNSVFKSIEFYGEYLRYFNKELSRADREYVVFDFISTPIVKYISKKELDIWVSEVGLLGVMVLQRNGNSWMLTGRKP